MQMPELLPELSVRRRGGRLGMYLERLNKILKLQKLLHPIQQRNRLFLRNLFMLGRLRRLQNLLLFLPAAKFFFQLKLRRGRRRLRTALHIY